MKPDERPAAKDEALVCSMTIMIQSTAPYLGRGWSGKKPAQGGCSYHVQKKR